MGNTSTRIFLVPSPEWLKYATIVRFFPSLLLPTILRCRSRVTSQILFDGMVEYEDGTPATESQMAKDVVEFLTWTAAPEHDTRMLMLLKVIGVLTVMAISILDLHKRNMSHLRSRRIAYIPKRT
ncbi:uncharacterized protein LOC143214411 [Lasioglossum baleicum]|uniref:uncharacterized protein LOC143214411 n=1 Tax=Lasioglossum baleicum TaxID=434251 RepID=UPI003FCC52CD